MSELPPITPKTKLDWRLEDLLAALERYNTMAVKVGAAELILDTKETT